jgi:hypothetical protein
MSNYINQISGDAIGVDEIIPLELVFNSVPTTPDTNQVFSAKRFDMNNPDDTGTDISANTAVSTNTISLSDIWTGSDTRVAGYYRLQVILQTAAGTIKEEMNLLVNVI